MRRGVQKPYFTHMPIRLHYQPPNETNAGQGKGPKSDFLMFLCFWNLGLRYSGGEVNRWHHHVLYSMRHFQVTTLSSSQKQIIEQLSHPTGVTTSTAQDYSTKLLSLSCYVLVLLLSKSYLIKCTSDIHFSIFSLNYIKTNTITKKKTQTHTAKRFSNT